MKASKCKLDVRAGAVMWATLCIFLGQPSQALPQEFFYQGKTITVISGREPGGLGDLRHKAILPYLKKHIPGQPNIVTEYMPGGGGRKVANHIYRTAQPDGLIIGSPPGGIVGGSTRCARTAIVSHLPRGCRWRRSSGRSPRRPRTSARGNTSIGHPRDS